MLDEARQQHFNVGSLGDDPVRELVVGAVSCDASKTSSDGKRCDKTAPVHRIRSGQVKQQAVEVAIRSVVIAPEVKR